MVSMPRISEFYGIVIEMYWSDHNPPHFHAKYAEHRAEIDIRTLGTLRGRLPAKAMAGPAAGHGGGVGLIASR